MKYEDWLAHFNPNHDKLGRFAKSNHTTYGKKTPVDKVKRYDRNKEKGKTLLDRFVSLFSDKRLKDVDKNSRMVRVGRSPEEIDTKIVKSVNPNRGTSPKYRTNCVNCVIAYALHSQFGIKAEARGSDVQNLMSVYSVFENTGMKRFTGSVQECISLIPNNSSGILAVSKNFLGRRSGHVINYEKDKRGVTTLVDAQRNIIESKDYSKIIPNSYMTDGYIDLSNAILSSDYKQIASNNVKLK
jgi:hypothetical protein